MSPFPFDSNVGPNFQTAVYNGGGGGITQIQNAAGGNNDQSLIANNAFGPITQIQNGGLGTSQTSVINNSAPPPIAYFRPFCPPPRLPQRPSNINFFQQNTQQVDQSDKGDEETLLVLVLLLAAKLKKEQANNAQSNNTQSNDTQA